MFNTGEKVVALTSSLRGTGPRRGSVGYVISKGHSAYVQELDAFLCIINVMFTRFGFEDKIRKEKKTFLNVLPIIYGRMSDSKVKEVTISTVKKLQTGHNFTHGMWDKLKKEWFPDRSSMVPIGILVPVRDNNTNLLQCHAKEFVVWLDAHLISNKFREIISIAMVSKYTSNTPINKNALVLLHNMANDRDTKKHYLAKMQEEYLSDASNPGRADLIEAIRALSAVAGGREIRNKLEHIDHIVHNDQILDRDGRVRCILVLSMLADGAFSPALNKPRMKCLKELGSANIDRVVLNMKRLTNLLGAFSSPLLGGENEKEVAENESSEVPVPNISYSPLNQQ